MDAAANRRKQLAGTVGALLNPQIAEREYVKRRITPPEPKNHMKENARRVRQKEREMKRKKEEANKPPKPLFKMPRFEKVESKTAEHIETFQTPAPSKEASNFLRKGEKVGPPTKPPPREHFDRSRIPLSVPAANDLAHIPARTHKNFIRNNAVEVIEGRVRSAKSRDSPSPTPDPPTHVKGQIPNYLRERKSQWREEEKRKKDAEPDPDAPPGMVLMPASERLETLAMLKKNHAEMLRQLQSMPMMADTIGLRQRRAAVEHKLGEIEEAIDIFSRPKVFVHPK